MILTIKTDQPMAELGLYDQDNLVDSYKWEAHRTLARDLLKVIKQRLDLNKADWPDIKGIVVFKGPGSFTGLRIGITVANTLAYANNIPIVGQTGDGWVKTGLKRLQKHNDKIVLPFYGGEANITLPKK